MNFSHKSEKYIEIIYNNFNTCMLNKVINPNSNSVETVFFKNFLNLIKKAERFIHSRNIQNNISKKHIIIDSVKQMRFPTIYMSNFFPENIKKSIETDTLFEYEYNTILDDRNINFHFYTHNNHLSYNKLDIYVNYMLMWIFIVNLYSENKCSKKLNIFIFLTDFEKELPQNNITILDKEQINTGYTIVCSPTSEIVIYRNEEWFKVFIHETLHNFGFDFSTTPTKEFDKNISKLFPINTDLKIYESYCEAWARIINVCFCSYNILLNKNKNEIKHFTNEFVSYCDFLLQIERVFSLYQVNKILNYNGINYEHIYKNDNISVTTRNNLYKEKASVFSYFIVTSILLNDYTNFLKWCKTNNLIIIKFNKIPRTIYSFYEFIKNNYKNKLYIQSLKCIEKITHSKKINNNDKLFNKSLRMTILELN